MAVLFSAVTITSDSDQAEFLVAGVPKSYADLEGWTAFETFMNEVDTEQDIKVHVAACLYGEGEVFTATLDSVLPTAPTTVNSSLRTIPSWRTFINSARKNS